MKGVSDAVLSRSHQPRSLRASHPPILPPASLPVAHTSTPPYVHTIRNPRHPIPFTSIHCRFYVDFTSLYCRFHVGFMSVSRRFTVAFASVFSHILAHPSPQPPPLAQLPSHPS